MTITGACNITLTLVTHHRPKTLHPVILSAARVRTCGLVPVEGPLWLAEIMRSEREHRYSVYILGSVSGTLYIGVTSDLVFRVRQHKDHTFRGFTANYDVDRLLYYETYGEVSTAIAREKQLKGWKRGKKIALIEKSNPQWRDPSRVWHEKPVITTFQAQS